MTHTEESIAVSPSSSSEIGCSPVKQHVKLDPRRMNPIAVASYLRSAIGRASERLSVAPQLQPEYEEEEEEEEKVLKSNDTTVSASKGDKTTAFNESEAANDQQEDIEQGSKCCDTISASGMELILAGNRLDAESVERDRPETEKLPSKYKVRYQYPEQDTPLPTPAPREEGRQQFFVDVVLQTDASGLGLNVGVNPNSASASGQEVLVVESFRRLHSNDIGPAEACGNIHVGDILCSIDGHSMQSLKQVQATMQTIAVDTFVLLRFLRFQGKDDKTDDDVVANSLSSTNVDSANPPPSKLNWSGNNHIATLIRTLVTKNQSLQEQLVASRLKQAEQAIQLDQLHVLYAKTQLEQFHTFSFAKSIKPFVRKPNLSNTVSTHSNGDNHNSGSPNGGDKTRSFSKIVSPSKLHTEIDIAVRAERERLQKQYAAELQAEKQQLIHHYDKQVAELKRVMDKKLEMLEVGFTQVTKHMLLRYRSTGIFECTCWNDANEFADMVEEADCERLKHEESCLHTLIERLVDELQFHHQNHHMDDTSHECMLCNFYRSVYRNSNHILQWNVHRKNSSSGFDQPTTQHITKAHNVVVNQEELMDILREYTRMKQQRIAQLQCMESNHSVSDMRISHIKQVLESPPNLQKCIGENQSIVDSLHP